MLMIVVFKVINMCGTAT